MEGAEQSHVLSKMPLLLTIPNSFGYPNTVNSSVIPSLQHFSKSVKKHQDPELLLFPCPESPERESRRQDVSRQGVEGRLRTAEPNPALSWLQAALLLHCRASQESPERSLLSPCSLLPVLPSGCRTVPQIPESHWEIMSQGPHLPRMPPRETKCS